MKEQMGNANKSYKEVVVYYKYAVIFCWKIIRICAKTLTFFSTKNNSVFDNVVCIYILRQRKIKKKKKRHLLLYYCGYLDKRSEVILYQKYDFCPND